MSGFPAFAVVPEDGHDTGPGAEALQALGPWRALDPSGNCPVPLPVALSWMSQRLLSADGHGESLCNLGIEVSEHMSV